MHKGPKGSIPKWLKLRCIPLRILLSSSFTCAAVMLFRRWFVEIRPDVEPSAGPCIRCLATGGDLNCTPVHPVHLISIFILENVDNPEHVKTCPRFPKIKWKSGVHPVQAYSHVRSFRFVPVCLALLRIIIYLLNWMLPRHPPL